MKRLLLGLLCISTLHISAQTSYCGTTLSEEQFAWLRNFQNNYSTNANSRDANTIYYVPVNVHIVGTDLGTGYIPTGTVLSDICNLNDQYADVGFYFYIHTLDYIDNSDYYVHDFEAGGEMMTTYTDYDFLNLYFVSDPAGNCGYYSPYGDGIALAISCSGLHNSTIAHEIGHYFSLPHTFYGWEYGTPALSDQERVDGLNCNSAADGFCDTPPDYLPYRWDCPGPEQTDQTGATFYSDGTLFMSYSNDACQTRFSNEQTNAMIANINGPRHALLIPAVPSYVDVADVTLVSPEEAAVFQYPNYTVLKWNKVSGAIAYDIQISYNISFTVIAQDLYVEDTFAIATKLEPERKYYWRAKAVAPLNTCEDFSAYRYFNTGAEYAAIEDNDSNTSNLSINPNPVKSGNTIEVEYNSTQNNNGLIQIFDISGKLTYSESITVVTGNNSIVLNTPFLSDGIYIIQLINGNIFSTRKFVVAN